jgi:hypothetical protein
MAWSVLNRLRRDSFCELTHRKSTIQMITKILKFSRSLVIGGLCLLAHHAQAISINIAGLGDLQFNGATDTFSFTNEVSGRDFLITSVTGPGATNSAQFLQGTIDGVYQIGAITTSGAVQTAPVTLASGTPLITIYDAFNIMLTATVQWIQIKTEGLTGGLNSAGGVLNLTNIQYTGANADLLTLKASGGGSGSAVITFQFDPGKSLTDLTTAGITETSYSGSLTANVPDGGTTAVLMGLGLLGVGFAGRRMKLVLN